MGNQYSIGALELRATNVPFNFQNDFFFKMQRSKIMIALTNSNVKFNVRYY